MQCGKYGRVLARCVAFALLGASAYPCNMAPVFPQPVAIREIVGTVSGWDFESVGIIEGNRMLPHGTVAIAGATLVLSVRTNTKFFAESDINPEMKYKCGKEVARTKSDAAGAFSISQLKPGKYCLAISRPVKTFGYAGPHKFLVDIVPSAPKATLLADIRERMPDCSGGESLKLRPVKDEGQLPVPQIENP